MMPTEGMGVRSANISRGKLIAARIIVLATIAGVVSMAIGKIKL